MDEGGRLGGGRKGGVIECHGLTCLGGVGVRGLSGNQDWYYKYFVHMY